jgi:thioesterase domain-containing protein
MRARPGLTEVDTVVAVTTICFDIAALEIFLPLMVGARLVVATSEEARDGAALATLLQRSKASLMQATPITWQMLVEAGWDSDITMLCGGEALTRKLADRLLARGGALWNMYGPTETTIWSAAGQVHEGDGPITIGPPIANTQLHVLNDVQQQTPLGGVGELYIGGDGVALGYLNRADLTRRGFLPDPFRSEPNARMYRSGDLVRRRADGSLEFLGRVDHQVKLRGFRIELGEVEAVLLQHPDVAAAVASLGKDGAGEDALCAYVVPAQSRRDADTDLIRELRRHLAELLPLHMLPSSISLLTALPRTANGKIDRRALPQPERNQPAVMAPAATHLRNTISRLSLIWQAVLGLQDISPDADFFELGGHSLLAVRMLRRVEAEFGERHRIATLFRAPTIRAFASVLGAYSEPPAEIEVAALQPHGTRPPIIAINNSGVFFSLAKALGQQQPFIAVFLAEPERRRELADRSLEDLATEYVGFMKQAQPKGPYILFGWCQAGVIAYEIAQQLLAAGEEVQLLAMADAWAPGYLRRLRWLRSLLADLSYRWQWHVAELRTGRLGLLEIALNSRYARKLGLVSVARGLLRKPDFLAEDAYAWYVDYLAARIARYQPKPYGGSVLLFHNPRQPSGRFLDRALGWTDLLRGRWKVVEVQGDHLSIFQAPGVDAIARWIEAALNGLEPWCGPERRPRSPDTTASTDNGNTAERLGSIKEELA